MRGVRASEIIVVKSESGQYISTGLTSSLGLFSLIYWPLSLFTPLRSLLWKVISEALTRGHKFILFSHHQYNQYKALLCSCSPISISAFMAFLGYFWFWMGDIEVVRWNGVDFLVPKHLRKSKIGLLEQIWAKNPYVTFFWVTLYIYHLRTHLKTHSGECRANAILVIMHPLRHAIWGPICKHTVAIVWINATSVTLRLPTYIIWGHIWKVTVGNVEQIGKNFKSFRKWRPQKHKKLFQQILVDMSNILGKHVYSVKIRRNLIRGIVFCAKAASVTDVFEIFAQMQSMW